MKISFLILLILFVGDNMPEKENSDQYIEKSGLKGDSDGIKITIIYDNYPFDGRLKTEWGFSCLIEGREKTILFDTGGDGAILLNNMERLAIDPNEIDAIFLSHEHWDHTGGLEDFLKHNHEAVVYLLASFPENIRNSITNAGAEFVEIAGPAYLCEKVATPGELGISIKEQSLVIETARGLVIVTGCAHPGIVAIIDAAKNYFEQNVYMVFGGFHLGTASDAQLKKIIEQFRKFGVEKVGPCHCSGERCRKLFLDAYKENFIDVGVGKILLIE